MGVDTVHVWLIGSDLSSSLHAQLVELLEPEERRRLARLRHRDRRRRFVAAHGALRLIVADHLGAAPRDLRWRRGPHGKPELAEPAGVVRVSLSHSGELAMVAVAERRPVGVDIQQVAGHLDAPRLAGRFFPAPEAALVAAPRLPAARLDRFVRLWVRKEACVKAAGGRLVHGLTLPVAGAGTAVVVRDPSGILPGAHLVQDLPVPVGFRAAVAVAAELPYRVIRHRWQPPSAG